MRRFPLLLSVLILVVTATQAGAVLLGVSLGVGTYGYRLHFNGSDQTGYHFYAGSLNGYLGGLGGTPIGSIYCVDLNGHCLPPDTYNVNTLTTASLSAIGPGNASRAAYLYRTYAPQVGTDVNKAGALQLALWDLVFDSDYDVYHGSFYCWDEWYTHARPLAQSYLDMLRTDPLLGASTTYYQPTGGRTEDGQGMIGPVPEPGSLLLLGMGLLGTGFVVRKRSKG